MKNKLNWLLLAFPVALFMERTWTSTQSLAFVFSMVAIMPLGVPHGEGHGRDRPCAPGRRSAVLLNATFGNAVEMIIAGLALYAASKSVDPETIATMITVTQASLIGSILGNLLLVLGLGNGVGGSESQGPALQPRLRADEWLAVAA